MDNKVYINSSLINHIYYANKFENSNENSVIEFLKFIKKETNNDKSVCVEFKSYLRNAINLPIYMNDESHIRVALIALSKNNVCEVLSKSNNLISLKSSYNMFIKDISKNFIKLHLLYGVKIYPLLEQQTRDILCNFFNIEKFERGGQLEQINISSIKDIYDVKEQHKDTDENYLKDILYINKYCTIK